METSVTEAAIFDFRRDELDKVGEIHVEFFIIVNILIVVCFLARYDLNHSR